MQRADPRPYTPVNEARGYLRDLIDLFLYQSPYWQADFANPFFYTGARNVRWLNSPDALRRFNHRVLQVAGGVLAAALLIGALLWRASGADFISTSLMLVTLVSLLSGVAVDVFCVYYGAQSVRALQRGVMLDLIRTTNAHAPTVMHARLAVARLYAWRPFFMLAASRLVVVLLWGVSIVIELLTPMPQAQGSFTAHQIAQLRGTTLGAYILVSVLLLAEPYWRYRAMTAVGVLQAIRRKSETRLWLSNVNRVLGFYLWQATVLVGGYVVTMFAGVVLDFGRLTVYLSQSESLVIPFVAGVLSPLVLLPYLLVIRQSQVGFASDDTLRDESYRMFQGYD